MASLPLICAYCKKQFSRELRYVNENKKLNQKPYCSLRCLGNSKKKRKSVICENLHCLKYISRTKAKLSLHNFCSNSCAAQFNNSKRPKKIRRCHNLFCKKIFTGHNKYCSLQCIPHKTSKYTKQIIIAEIKKFENKFGRIPTKQDLMKLYTPIKRLFGTWNNSIESAGFKPNPVRFVQKYIAKDGHKCDSLAEKIIDDWLYEKKLDHVRRISYPENPKLTVDFVVGEYWVEFFGLCGEHKRYDELRREKLKYIKNNNLKFIDIYPKHLFPKNMLSELFANLININ